MEKVKVKPETGEKRGARLILQAVIFVLSFFLGAFSPGDFSGFAPGFTAGVPQSLLLSTAVGCTLGAFCTLKLFDSLKCITAVCVITFVRLGFSDKIRIGRKMLFTALLAFFSCLASCAAVFFASGENLFFLIEGAGEAAVSAAFACFTLRSSEIVFSRSVRPFSPADRIALMFTLCVLLSGISYLRLYGFSFGTAAAVSAVLLFTASDFPLLSAAAGVCAGIALGFDDSVRGLLPAFASGGLLAGICAPGGRAASAAGLFFSFLLCVTLSGEPETALPLLSEALVGCAVFVLLPEKLSGAVRVLLGGSENDSGGLLSLRLRYSAKAVRDVSESVSAVSKLLARLEKPSPDRIPDRVKCDVCADCPKKSFCWDGAADITGMSFEKSKEAMIKNGALSEKMLPERLKTVCGRKALLTDSFNRHYCEHAAEVSARGEINETKAAAASLFGAAGALLDDAADSASSLPRENPVHTRAVREVLREFGIVPVKVIAAEGQNGRHIAEAFCSAVPPMPDISPLLIRLYEETGISFMPPAADEYSRNGTVLSFAEEGKYSVSFSSFSHPGAGEEYSGDSHECFFDGKGSFYAVLSDGMGTGGRAAVDSVMTCTLMSRLLRSGFSPETAALAVNCALMIKSQEETLATLDIVKIDSDTGKIVFYKAGAAASIVKKNGKTAAVELSSPPLGILTHSSLKTSETVLSGGDTVLLMSDGAGELPPQWFREMLGKPGFSSPEEIARETVGKAVSLSASGKNDDITVVCAKLIKNE